MKLSDLELLTENSGLSFNIKADGSVTEIVEASRSKNASLVLRGVPSTILGEINKNNRKYTKQRLEQSIAKSKAEGLFENLVLTCTANDHPSSGTFVPPIHSSHVIIDAYIKKTEGKDYLFTDWKILDTDNGRNLKALIDAGVGIGTSIRGLGKINENTKEVEEYQFLGCDAVGNPSAGTYMTSKFEVKISVEESSNGVIESINSDEGDSKIMETVNESLKSFREKYYKNGVCEKVNPEMIESLVSLASEVIKLDESTDEYKDYQTLKTEVFRTVAVPEDKKEVKESAEDQGKLQEMLEQVKGQVGASDLMVAELKARNDKLNKAIEGASKVIRSLKTDNLDLSEKDTELRNNSKQMVEDLKGNAVTMVTGLRDNAVTMVEDLRERAVIMVGDIRENAIVMVEEFQEEIHRLKNISEVTIEIGDQLAEHLKASVQISSSLEEYIKDKEDKEEKQVYTRSTESKAAEARRKQGASSSDQRGWH